MGCESRKRPSTEKMDWVSGYLALLPFSATFKETLNCRKAMEEENHVAALSKLQKLLLTGVQNLEQCITASHP